LTLAVYLQYIYSNKLASLKMQKSNSYEHNELVKITT